MEDASRPDLRGTFWPRISHIGRYPSALSICETFVERKYFPIHPQDINHDYNNLFVTKPMTGSGDSNAFPDTVKTHRWMGLVHGPSHQPQYPRLSGHPLRTSESWMCWKRALTVMSTRPFPSLSPCLKHNRILTSIPPPASKRRANCYEKMKTHALQQKQNITTK